MSDILISVPNISGSTSINVRVVKSDEAYGDKGKLVNKESEPLVEFYDSRYDFDLDADNKSTGRGQFITRYNLSTILELKGGLLLDAGSPCWTLAEDAVREVQSALEKELGLSPKNGYWLVCGLERSNDIQVGSHTEELKLTWAPGMVGVMAVFATENAARDYAGTELDVIQIFTSKIFEVNNG